MHYGAARIALLAYVLGGILLPMTHRHAAPAGPLGLHAHHGHGGGHAHHGHDCRSAGPCQAEASDAAALDGSARPPAVATFDRAFDPGGSHLCHGSCALCLAAGQTVTLSRQCTAGIVQVPQCAFQPTADLPPRSAALPRANLLRGPPALVS